MGSVDVRADRVDPLVGSMLGKDYRVIEPIGFGFMASLERYAEVHRRYPTSAQLMGVGNITELTSADSTGVNAVLLAIWTLVISALMIQTGDPATPETT